MCCSSLFVYDVVCVCLIAFGLLDVCFLMIRRPPRSTLDRSSAASDVYKRQLSNSRAAAAEASGKFAAEVAPVEIKVRRKPAVINLSLIHISEPTRPY